MKHRIYTKDDYIDIGKYEKSKYEIFSNSELIYKYVTTSRSPEECVQLLSDKAKTIYSCITRGYKIYRTTNEGKELVCVGKKSIP
jgi:hypothetical protein